MTKEDLLEELKARAEREGNIFFLGKQSEETEKILWQLFHENKIGFSYAGHEGDPELEKRRITVRF